MVHSTLRVGLIGAGRNTRARHIPGLRAIPGVEIVGVCNRRPGSAAAVAREYEIPRVYDHWEELIAEPGIDAIVIGTWPYLHCQLTLAALERGKHVLTEARLGMNAAEAHRMLEMANRSSPLVAQVVPSPFGLKGHDVFLDLLRAGYLGNLREVHAYHLNDALADPASPLSWRQDAALSGFNMLTLGIIHETLLRWIPHPMRVQAQAHAFIPTRIDPESGVRRAVGTPDSVQALTVLQGGARAVYQFSGATPFGQAAGVWLYGSEGVLHYDFLTDQIKGANRGSALSSLRMEEVQEIPIPRERERSWEVEAEFVSAIRDKTPIRFTDFATGVAYMEFTEAVARSAESGEAIDLPLTDFHDEK